MERQVEEFKMKEKEKERNKKIDSNKAIIKKMYNYSHDDTKKE